MIGEKPMKKIYIINFSPTGTSLKVAEQIVEKLDYKKISIDLCEEISNDIQIEHDSICIFSMPCYGGRIPQTAIKRLAHIQGSKTVAVVCVTFGNRAFEDALLELADSVESNGFQVIAGGAIATEHSIMHIYGQGRPDDLDKEEIKKFSMNINKKLKSCKLDRPSFPGNRPYKEWNGAKTPIIVDEMTCINCGLCALKCPVKAISSDGRKVKEEVCINCMRCIKLCPQKSRSLSEIFVSTLIQHLNSACEERKANEFYL